MRMRRPNVRVVSLPAMVATAGAAALLSGLLTGCQAGTNAQTSQPFNPVTGRNVNVPASPGYYDPYLAVRGVTLVENSSGEVVLVAKVINKTEESEDLVSVTAGDSAATLIDAPVTIPAGGTASFGVENGESAYWASLSTAPGHWTDVTMSFSRSGEVTLRVLVELNRNDYAGVYFPPAPSTTDDAGSA
jgi:hypothetical protein